MPKFSFAITVPATMTAMVEVEADTIEEAQDRALSKDFYRDPAKADFQLDEGNGPDDAYLPDEGTYDIVEDETPAPGM